MTSSDDLQSQAILNGLVDLEKALNRPLANKALDLEEKKDTAEQKDILVRLRKSLTQYVKRTRDLLYVACIGHFSSGKSSTINSLLELWNSTLERDSDQNPTDDSITLISHEDNAQRLFPIVGSGLPTRLITIESAMLKDMVIVDTPGSGDPEFIDDMARDFLPICDLVLFFLNATNPLDKSDKPMLLELHERLPFVPIKFVITRANELRKDDDAPISASNFDEARAATFLADIVSRVAVLLETSKYGVGEFVLIDNKKNFNIDVLRNDLLRRIEPSEFQEKLKMHSQKVKFFQTTSESLLSYFSSILEGKLAELTRVVRAADNNIDKYNNDVKISNSSLEMNWVNSLTTIRTQNEKASERIKAPHNLPAALSNAEPVAAALAETKSFITGEAAWVAKEVQKRTMQTGFIQLQAELSVSERALKHSDLDTLSPQSHNLVPKAISWTLGDTELIPVRTLAKKTDDLRDKTQGYVTGMIADTRKAVEDLQRLVQNRFVIDKCEDEVKTAQESLSNDLDSYFRNVQVYRAAVVAMTTKDSIAKLGIGKRLDELETEFTEEEKESIKIKVREELFPSFEERMARISTTMATINEELRVLLKEIAGVKLEPVAPSQTRVAEGSQLPQEELIREIESGLQQEADAFIGNAQTEFARVIAATLNNYDNEISAARSARFLRYAALMGSTAGLGAIVYLLWHRLQQPVGQSIAAFLGWGIALEAFLSGGSFLIAWYFDNFPQTKTHIKEKHLAVLGGDIKSASGALVKDYQFSVLQEGVLGKKLQDLYLSLVRPEQDEWTSEIDELYRKSLHWNSKYGELRRKYLSMVAEFAKGTSSYFEDAPKNITILASAANEIKERALKPPFGLLHDFRGELQSVQEDISLIRFT